MSDFQHAIISELERRNEAGEVGSGLFYSPYTMNPCCPIGHVHDILRRLGVGEGDVNWDIDYEAVSFTLAFPNARMSKVIGLTDNTSPTAAIAYLKQSI